MCKLPGRFLPAALAAIQSLLMACSGSAGRPEGIRLTAAQPPIAGLVMARTVPVGASVTLAVAPGATLPDDTLLRIGFDEAPALGPNGTVKIHRAFDDAVVDTIDLIDKFAIFDGTSSIRKLTTHLTSSRVNVIGGLHTGIDQVRLVNYVPIIISGNTATIYPHNNMLDYGTQYYVTIDAGVLNGNVNGTPFAGVDANNCTSTTK